MDIFSILAIVALVATVVVLVRGIAYMLRGGEADYQASTHLMFRRVEFQAAAVLLALAAIFFAAGRGESPPSTANLTADLGVVAAADLRERYEPDSPEAKAYGGIPDGSDLYLVTVTLADRATGEALEDASVTATVGRLGQSGRSRELRAAALHGGVTYGNYFRMAGSGDYQIRVEVAHPELGGIEVMQFQYPRP